MATLSVTGLTVRLGSPPQEVLKDVTFSAPAGSVILLLGANGSGKSVLLRTILGLHRSLAGRILLDGELSGVGRRATPLHRRSGICFQNAEMQIFGETVREDLTLGFRGSAVSLSSSDGYGQIAATFGLQPLLDRSPMELSGGQRRRLAIAGAFVGEPEIIFLDEPFLELDYPHIQALIGQISVARDRGAIVLVASHETRDIWETTDHVILLQSGAILAQGTPDVVAPHIAPEAGLRPVEGSRDG